MSWPQAGGPFGSTPFSSGGSQFGAGDTGGGAGAPPSGITGSQAGTGATGLLKGFGDILAGFQKSQQYGSEQQAASGNAAFDTAAGKTAFMTAANRGGQQIRQGAEAVGSQAAAIGQSGSGIADASSQNVVRQSETNQRMDFLNTIYGGQVAKSNYDREAQQQEYQAKVAGLNKQNAMYGGFMSAGSDALTTAAMMAML